MEKVLREALILKYEGERHKPKLIFMFI